VQTDLKTCVAGDVQGSTADYRSHVKLASIIHRGDVGLGVRDVTSNVPVRVSLGDDVPDRTVAMKVNGDLFEVLEPAAQQQAAGQGSAKCDGGGRERAMSSAGFRHEPGRYRGNTPQLIFGGGSVNKLVTGLGVWLDHDLLGSAAQLVA
jgi:hypothetical protein